VGGSHHESASGVSGGGMLAPKLAHASLFNEDNMTEILLEVESALIECNGMVSRVKILLDTLKEERAKIIGNLVITPRAALDVLRANAVQRILEHKDIMFVTDQGMTWTCYWRDYGWKKYVKGGANNYEARVDESNILEELKTAVMIETNVT
jgi:hypothetical protein